MAGDNHAQLGHRLDAQGGRQSIALRQHGADVVIKSLQNVFVKGR
jgi:hypothetical protein